MRTYNKTNLINYNKFNNISIYKIFVIILSNFVRKESKPMIARAGEWDLKTEKENFPHQDQRVSKYVTHSKFYKGALHNDIALVFLEAPFTLQENIQTICLPKQDDSFTDVPCYASGWGKTVSLNNFTIEKKTKTGSISKSFCDITKYILFN